MNSIFVLRDEETGEYLDLTSFGFPTFTKFLCDRTTRFDLESARDKCLFFHSLGLNDVYIDIDFSQKIPDLVNSNTDIEAKDISALFIDSVCSQAKNLWNDDYEKAYRMVNNKIEYISGLEKFTFISKCGAV